MREPDNPTIKDAIMAELHGEVKGYLKAQGYKEEKDFATGKKEIFQCSKRIFWVDRIHPEKQVVIVHDSLNMAVEYGLSYRNDPPKGEQKVIKRKKIEGLRCNISDGTKQCLTGGSQKGYNEFLEEVKKEIESLKA